ncbi:hypothetical protein PENTCL1PPCAC_14752, partial [Pristionchus entomophagus]
SHLLLHYSSNERQDYPLRRSRRALHPAAVGGAGRASRLLRARRLTLLRCLLRWLAASRILRLGLPGVCRLVGRQQEQGSRSCSCNTGRRRRTLRAHQRQSVDQHWATVSLALFLFCTLSPISTASERVQIKQ